MEELKGKIVLVTGASSGFGEAIALSFARAGATLAIGARRVDRLQTLAKKLGREFGCKIHSEVLDVRQTSSVRRFVEGTLGELGHVDVLVNNAGLALGRETLRDANEDDWTQMIETNFLGTFRMTQALLPSMLARKSGHIVNIGSIAGHEAYAGGAGYCGTKFAARAMTIAVREELLGTGIRVTSIDPGMAETEFSIVRFKGDQEKAKQVYKGVTPLSAEDVAECVLFAVTRPAHVNIETILLNPTAQVNAKNVHRTTE
ncbi:MAG TPA: SDR family NAD(P)-dependent oxidoreductase [Bdellovibrionota bacterium]|nr:SDR family NAD(P)-dependent oxidoreductase [Bdellovibrionota bacterium]